MTRPTFTEALKSRPWLLADGATGTNYFQMGLVSGDAPEMWNFEHPERVRQLHREFIAAGDNQTEAYVKAGYRVPRLDARKHAAALQNPNRRDDRPGVEHDRGARTDDPRRHECRAPELFPR